jgi:hypothetical protein
LVFNVKRVNQSNNQSINQSITIELVYSIVNIKLLKSKLFTFYLEDNI